MNTPRYINPLTDFGFKKIFGNEDVMIAFLNDLLEPKSPIVHVTFIDKDELGQTKYERGVIYDLRCKCDDNSQVIVEMQNRAQLNFSDRILYYLSRSISSQVEIGNVEWDYKLTPVYGIFFLNFNLQGFKPQSIRTIQLKVNETGEIFNENVKAFTLELTNYRKKNVADCKNFIDYWMFNLANMETMTTEMPFQKERPIFEKVGTISQIVNMSAEELAIYNVSLDTYRTNLSAMKNERKEGREEGRKEKAFEIARLMLQQGESIDKVILYSGLTKEQVESLI